MCCYNLCNNMAKTIIQSNPVSIKSYAEFGYLENIFELLYKTICKNCNWAVYQME